MTGYWIFTRLTIPVLVVLFYIQAVVAVSKDEKIEKELEVLRKEVHSVSDPPHGEDKGSGDFELEGSGEAKHDGAGGGGGGVSLGKILGLLFLVCCILYCIGIGWKIFKIVKGTYVEEEPVFLKYK